MLITGAAGFLGSCLSQRLLSAGHDVIGVDNFSSGQRSRFAVLQQHPRFTGFEYGVECEEILTLKPLEDVQEIYHLASPASPRFYQAAPLETIAANTAGTHQMLRLARRNKASMVYASTSEAYGDPQVHPQPENYWGNVNTWGPRACYDEGKRLGEVYCYEYFDKFQVKVKVARIFNTYSAELRNDDGRVISNFVNQAIQNQDITVYGDGSQTRSFCYVDDLLGGLIRMMESDAATGEIINLGNPQEYRVLEVAELTKRLAQSHSRITFHPLPENDPRIRRPVIDKAKALLGWEPVVTLEEGLLRTIEIYRSRFNKYGGGA
ncbi:NAD-dependent epimerase/dehydratase family protein [Paenibacillus sp. F411]